MELALSLSNGTGKGPERIEKQLENHKDKGTSKKLGHMLDHWIKRVKVRTKLFYDCDTVRGSSGSPVVTMVKDKDDEYTTSVVVGIHNGGMDKLLDYDEDSNKQWSKINYAHKTLDILDRFSDLDNDGGHITLPTEQVDTVATGKNCKGFLSSTLFTEPGYSLQEEERKHQNTADQSTMKCEQTFMILIV